MSVTNIPNSRITPNRISSSKTDTNSGITSMAVRLARANELNLKRILAKGEEVEDKDILDALVDPLHRSSLYVDEEQGCFVKVDNRIDKALETFTPVSELTLVTSKAAKTKQRKAHNGLAIKDLTFNMPEKWRSYVIDFSLVLAFLLIVFYGFSTA